MPATFFTLEQANKLLPELEPLMKELLNRRAKVVVKKDEIADIIDDTYSNVGSRITSNLTQDFIIIEKLIQKIRNYGCEVKDLNVGLLDFLSIVDDQEVYLCWRYGEPSIQYYHELHTGFNERRKLKE